MQVRTHHQISTADACYNPCRHLQVSILPAHPSRSNTIRSHPMTMRPSTTEAHFPSTYCWTHILRLESCMSVQPAVLSAQLRRAQCQDLQQLQVIAHSPRPGIDGIAVSDCLMQSLFDSLDQPHLKMAPAHVRPAPKPAEAITSPFCMLPALTASSKARGIDAADVLPYSFRLDTTLQTQKRLIRGA